VSGLLGLLGLGLRGGNLVVGVDGVRSAIRQGKCRCVVLASDASGRVDEKVVRLAEGRKIPRIVGPDALAMGRALGRPPVMAVGVLDSALARGVLQLGGSET